MNIMAKLLSMQPQEVAKLPAHLTLADQERLKAGTLKPKHRRQAEPEAPYPWATPGRTVTLTLEGWHPMSLNRWGRSQGQRKRAVSEAYQQVIAAAPELYLPQERRPANLLPYWRPRVEIVIYQTQERYPDPGNWHKALVDSLKRAGLIRDDNHTAIELAPERFPVDPGRPRTEIMLMELGPQIGGGTDAQAQR